MSDKQTKGPRALRPTHGRHRGCHAAQGHLFGEPQPIAAIMQRITKSEPI